MAVVNFSIKLLASLGVDVQKLDQFVDLLGMEVEKKEGDEIYVDITPNRPDLLDLFGFARAMRYMDLRLTPKSSTYKLKNSPEAEVIVSESVKRVRPVIAAMVVKGADLQEGRLKHIINFMEKFSDTYGRHRRKVAMGLHNLDAVEPPFYYDAKNEGSFVPLGGKSPMEFDRILKEHSKGVNYGYTLGKSELYPVLSDSKGRIMSLIPIINSELTRVTESTRNLLVDITGTSESAVGSALDMMACSFIDAGFEVYPCIIKRNGAETTVPQLNYKELKVRPREVWRTLGTTIEPGRIITMLNKLGYDGALYGRYVLAYVPPYRVDVLNQQDIIEDIAIGYGYNSIAPTPVVGTSIGIADEHTEFCNKLSLLLVGMGFTEAMNNYLTNEDTNSRKMLRRLDSKSIVRLAYSKVETFTMLRTSILPCLLENLSGSSNEAMPQKLFETGSVFGIEGKKPFESGRIAFVSEHSKANFAEVKSYIEALLGTLGIDYKLAESNDASFIKGRCAAIITEGNDAIGVFGELAPEVLDNFRLEEPVVGAEINIDPLIALASAGDKISNQDQARGQGGK
ncbi:MAG: phenylalanine--tRNA ligase subunit beta [Candidatus Micrarchaeia archaeon]